MREPHPYLQHGPLVLAHRGGAAEVAENTRAAFQHAAAHGLRYIETDVRATADGIVLIHHDASLERRTTGSGLIAHQEFRQMRHLRLVGTDEPLLTLDEALGDFPTMAFNIDCKDDHTVAPLVATLRRHGRRVLDRVLIGAFSTSRLRRLRHTLGPRLATSTGPLEVALLKLRSRRLPAPAPGPAVVATQVPRDFRGLTVVDEAFVTASHEAGLQVHVWVINDPDDVDTLINLGVDGIVTDRPAVLRDYVTQRPPA